MAAAARTPRIAGVGAAGAPHARRLSWLLLAALVGLAATGCDSRLDEATPRGGQEQPIRIVALGDSTTEAGWEGNAETVYAERLAAALKQHGVEAAVINAGVSNTTSLQAVERLDSDVRHHAPDYVIVQFGINDSWIDASKGRTAPRLTLEQYGECLQAIVETLRSDGAEVILMTPNPMRWSAMYGDELRDPALGFDFDDPRGINRLLDVYAERARKVARQEKVPLVDVLERFEAHGSVPGQDVRDLLIPNDDIHPNDAGHALIAQWLLEVILADLVEGRNQAAS